MVKTLEDYCLACIAKNIIAYSRLRNLLSPRHKEVLLERLCWHEQLPPAACPSIIYNLFSHTLLRINLSHSSQITDTTLNLLGNSGCLPTSFTLQDCPNVTDRGLVGLARILRKTEVLKLKRLKQVTSEGIKPISSRALKTVSLSECAGVCDSGVIGLVTNCPNIETLSLCELHKLTDASLTQVAVKLGEHLVELKTSDMNLVTSKSTSCLAQYCRNLSIAKFESCVRLDGAGLMQMAEWCPLTELNISLCYKVSIHSVDVIVSLLRAGGRVTKFEAMGIAMSGLSMEMIGSTSCLSSLSLCGVTSLTDQTLEMILTAAGSTLSSLDLSNCLSLTNQALLSIVRHCSCLEQLGLRNLQTLNGSELSNLFTDHRAKSFRGITLSGSKNVPSAVVMDIAVNCVNLEVLFVAGLRSIDDSIAMALARNCPNAKQISLRNSLVTDEGVCELALHCPGLTMLAIAGIGHLTDKCIIALAENCPHMTELFVSGCAKITRQAITYLKDSAIGYVSVKHNIPNAPIGLVMGKDLDTGEYTRVDDLEFDSLRVSH